MLRDLAESEANGEIAADVLIVGSGIAGLLLAHRLRKGGHQVAILESGAREQPTATHDLNRVVQIGQDYRGAMHGRFRCLGGTSTRWGGALLPFMQEDLAARPHVGLDAWPLSFEALRPHLAEVERVFDLDSASYDEAFVHEFASGKIIKTGDPEFIPRFAKWPPFKKRNLATLFRREIETDDGLAIWLNATVTDFELDGDLGRLRSVTGRSRAGRRIKVTAEHVVICAGAIESTRLLLLLHVQSAGRAFEASEALGRYLNDHLSAAVATIASSAPALLNRMAGLRFVGRNLRSLRFEISPATQAREKSASAFAHISFAPEGENGFDALRDFFRSVQQRGQVDRRLAWAILRDMPYLCRVGMWRIFRRQLYWPIPARYELHVVVEQLPQAANQIRLADEKDMFGNPLAAIDWSVRQADLEGLLTFNRLFDGYWKRSGYDDVGRLAWLADRPLDSSGTGIGDVYHPCGSTRMGDSRRSAVVDSNLRTHAVPNLWVAATSVFPSSASANPTLMLMLLTLRLAQHLDAILKKKDLSTASA